MDNNFLAALNKFPKFAHVGRILIPWFAGLVGAAKPVVVMVILGTRTIKLGMIICVQCRLVLSGSRLAGINFHNSAGDQ